MDFVDRLVARAQGLSSLSAGSFSDLAVDARDSEWIDQCVNELSDLETRLSTDLLLRALHTADFIVTEIESQGLLLEFLADTSRDILLYEALHFSVYALSDALCRTVPSDKFNKLSHFQDVACLTASILGAQHLGSFDSDLHSHDRAQRYLPHAGKLREMTEALIGVLIASRGATAIEPSSTLCGREAELEIEVCLRSTVNGAVEMRIGEGAERLSRRYTESPEPAGLARA